MRIHDLANMFGKDYFELRKIVNHAKFGSIEAERLKEYGIRWVEKNTVYFLGTSYTIKDIKTFIAELK